MTVFSGSDGDTGFEIVRGSETVAESPEYESTNVLRVAGLATMNGDGGSRAAEVASELTDLGIAESLAYRPPAWDSDEIGRAPHPSLDLTDRVSLWEQFNVEGRAEAANAFLVAVLGSRLERESTAAAAVLWRPDLDPVGRVRIRAMQTLPWLDPLLARRAKLLPPWQDVYAAALTDRRGPRRDQRVVTALARNRLERSLVSPDPIARSLANAALLRTVRDETPPSTAGAPVSAPTTVSIMVHGTRGFRGDWWRPPGEFHGYIRQGLRPDLYSDGKRFTWTGNLSAKDRKMAGAYLVEWEPKGLHAVFAHSYGGEVAARAIVAALPVQELVLLSSVVNGHVVAALSRCPLVIDVRLRFDPVLAIAGSAQRLPERDNVAVVLFRRWNLDHSATHSTKAWLSEGVLGRVNAWH